MTDPFTLRLEWRGNELWLGPFRVTILERSEFGSHCGYIHPGVYLVRKTEAAARTALWDAAIEMLTKDEMK